MIKFRKENGNMVATMEVIVKPNSERTFEPAEINIHEFVTDIYDAVIASTKQWEEIITKILKAEDVVIRDNFIFSNNLHKGFHPAEYENLTACIDIFATKIFTRDDMHLSLLYQIFMQEFTLGQLAQMLIAIGANPLKDMTAFKFILDLIAEKQRQQFE